MALLVSRVNLAQLVHTAFVGTCCSKKFCLFTKYEVTAWRSALYRLTSSPGYFFLLNLLWQCSWKINKIYIELLFLICRLCDSHLRKAATVATVLTAIADQVKRAPRCQGGAGKVVSTCQLLMMNKTKRTTTACTRVAMTSKEKIWIGWRRTKWRSRWLNIVMTDDKVEPNNELNDVDERWRRWSRLGFISIFII